MATDADKAEFDRQAIKATTQPFKPFPRIPDRFKRNPEDRAAWQAHEAAIDDWVRSYFTVNPPAANP